MSGNQHSRYTVLFSGNVQGVGFRFTTSAIAKRHEVSGYVRNLPDGRVELIAEGSLAELDKFLTAIRQRMQDFIRDAEIDRSQANGEFTAFTIRT